MEKIWNLDRDDRRRYAYPEVREITKRTDAMFSQAGVLIIGIIALGIFGIIQSNPTLILGISGICLSMVYRLVINYKAIEKVSERIPKNHVDLTGIVFGSPKIQELRKIINRQCNVVFQLEFYEKHKDLQFLGPYIQTRSKEIFFDCGDTRYSIFTSRLMETKEQLGLSPEPISKEYKISDYRIDSFVGNVSSFTIKEIEQVPESGMHRAIHYLKLEGATSEKLKTFAVA
ncbi:MAG: hypothetical protein KA028_01425 [Candidatus Pacebacteria bacterium]|nr:hypothetical protein [Candidatus Paceibacterota bacterium]MBP9851776.1 hypothetical protein [Candidatus Paceibacterota bacterium]